MTLNLSHKILKAVNASDQPLHTAGIARQFQGLSHYRVQITLIRLMNSGETSGRLLDVAKGIWIWWRKDAFGKVKG